jgi:hypothetical protein
MKISVESADGANRIIAQSYFTAFYSAGYNTVWYEPEGKSANDIFFEQNPIDIFIGHTWKLTRALVKNLIKYKNGMKVVLFANHFGQIDEEIAAKYPIEFASAEEKTLVKQLLDNGVNLVGLLCQYFPSSADKTHGYWKEKIGIECHGFPLSADVTQYYLTKPSVEYYTDTTFVGGRWPYKEKYLDKYLSLLCYPNNYKVRIFGSGWNVVNAVGRASEESIRNHFASSSFVVSLYEPHVELIGDISQRAYQPSACGGFQISQRAVDFELAYSNNEVPTFDNEDEFMTLVKEYAGQDNFYKTTPFRKKQCKKVYSEHTNFHRAVKLANLLNIDNSKLTKIIDSNYQNIINKMENIY